MKQVIGFMSDRHIAAAQILLKKKITKVDGFPKVDGLQLPTLVEAGRCNNVVGEGIHILNDLNKVCFDSWVPT